MLRKVVYNNCYGGFSLSREAVLLGRELSRNPNWGGPCIKGDMYDDKLECDYDYGYIASVSRHDPILVALVEKLGKQSNGDQADLQIKEIEGKYRIDDYNGRESVMLPDSYDWY